MSLFYCFILERYFSNICSNTVKKQIKPRKYLLSRATNTTNPRRERRALMKAPPKTSGLIFHF